MPISVLRRGTSMSMVVSEGVLCSALGTREFFVPVEGIALAIAS